MNLAAITIILTLALGIPALAVAAAHTRPMRQAASNTAGIALQTVIIIVVMLLIAGGVSGVLLSRSSEVIGDLEATGTPGVIASVDDCRAAGGAPTNATAGTGTTHCFWDLDTASRTTVASCRGFKGGGTMGSPPTGGVLIDGGKSATIINGSTNGCIVQLA